MARLRRVELFSPTDIAVIHVMSRVVRQYFLMGEDPLTGKNFNHRKVWIEAEIQRLAIYFGIDLLAYSLMSNHMHMVLRSRPDVVQSWDDTEVARRWLMLCPKRKHQDGSPQEPSGPELNAIRNNPAKLREIRLRLSDISWWMRLLCQRIAQRANREDGKQGKFWESRYRAVRLLDEQALLACAAYVDLNPIRAAMAETLEASQFTSIQRRILAESDKQTARSARHSAEAEVSRRTTAETKSTARKSDGRPDSFLAPVGIDELKDALGNRSSHSKRCSDKGFASLTSVEYIQLLDWTARQASPGKRGATPADTPPILERLGIRVNAWTKLVSDFGNYFSLVAGKEQTVDNYRSPMFKKRFHLKEMTRELLSA